MPIFPIKKMNASTKLNKKVDNSIIIYKDKPAATSLYFSVFERFLLFCVPIIWAMGLYFESYDYWKSENLWFFIVLLLLSIFFGGGIWTKLVNLINIEREKPLIKINVEGVQILGNKLRYWTTIKHIKLVETFTLEKCIALVSYNEQQSMNCMLYNAYQINEFYNLKEFENILKQFNRKSRNLPVRLTL